MLNRKCSFLMCKAFLKEIRIHHQLKNTLIFIPLLLGHYYNDACKDVNTLVAFLSFFFVTSSVYLLNDIRDLKTDQLHHTKKNRPLASGIFPFKLAVILTPIFAFIGLGLSLYVSFLFALILLIYLLVTLFYSFFLKKIILMDVFTLAFLYTLRVLAGGVAASVSISPWLLSFSLFFFLGLAYVKRYIELLSLQTMNINQTRDKSYINADISSIKNLGIASNYVSVLVLALYINSTSVQVLYSYPQVLWLAVVTILYFINKLWLMAGRGIVNEDPVLFLLKDRSFLVTLLVVSGIILISNHLSFINNFIN